MYGRNTLNTYVMNIAEIVDDIEWFIFNLSIIYMQKISLTFKNLCLQMFIIR